MGILESAFNRERRVARVDPYEDLAIAIVQTAVDDFRALRRSLARSNQYDRPVIEGHLREIKLFFQTDYADVLCFGHAQYIWDLLCKEYGA